MKRLAAIAIFGLTCCTHVSREHRAALQTLEPVPTPLFDLLMRTEFPKLADFPPASPP